MHKPGASDGWPDANRNFPTLWKEYAREFLNPHFLPHALRVNFNRWYVNPDYRREIAAQLGWTFNDRGFGSKAGWRFSLGSSFGEIDAKNLHLFSRWRHFEGDCAIRRLLRRRNAGLVAVASSILPHPSTINTPVPAMRSALRSKIARFASASGAEMTVAAGASQSGYAQFLGFRAHCIISASRLSL